MMNIILISLAVLIVLNSLFFAINILQNGPTKWNGKTLQEILGIDPSAASVSDIEVLSKAAIMQLFYSSDAPRISELQGEYKTKMLHAGIYGRMNDLYVNCLMGPGAWVGDAFMPFGEKSGHGYNIFRSQKMGKEKLTRTLKMNTFIGQSVFDKKKSFHVDYRPHGKGLNKSMQDELRKINDRLYLGLAYFPWTGGRKNPFPFVIHGQPTPWVGGTGEIDS